jgi:hypothetical protein
MRGAGEKPMSIGRKEMHPESFGVYGFRRLPKAVFEEIVFRLMNQKSIYSTARWLEDLRPEGCEFAFNTWRRHLRALRDSMQSEMARQSQHAVPSAAVTQQVLGKFSKVKADLHDEDDYSAEEIRKSVSKAVRTLDAMTLLKYSFMAQKKRVDRLLSVEEKIQMNVKDGYKEILVLKSIAAEIAKLELGNLLIRQKELGPGEAFKNTNLESEAPRSAMAERISKLGIVDRNLVLVCRL